ncbi:uncharacterized protein MYCGRDRAFT_90957 [Zymoseptoria tritici IPO323]|uniref:DNA helicase Pif1-like 2B domain-containing protein n=1 Tax=Zymoseptoria tritici (strain CBS 115943 / IPO323) TaxID=336722 RepID=F9X3T7_ZYMTI|nr:uncharacterized protein MYCGRDRAFT_90957 [Zymoseptoria tritici IPO323]EGP90402.1 hypothetical protein MYCGRDRAFT_90957 [Zymoseptoria tritici IPO323]
MLRGAVKDHEQKNGPPHLSQSTFPSSQSKSTTQSTNPGYRPPLKQSSASAVNEVKSYQTHRGGIKRTASGLAKAMGGSFDDERPGSQYQPIVLGGGSAPPEDFFGENDFDSDIDLDVEEPLALGGISYPELPKQTSRPNPPKQASRSNQPPGQQIRYPTLPTARSTETTATPSRGLMSPPARTELPGSSAPLPWSSSPLEHFSSALPQQSLQKFAFDGRQPTSKDTLRRASPEPKPAKRRTLPWQAQTSEEPPRTAAPRTQIFAGMLNEMREGRLTESSTAAFRKLSRPLSFDDMLDATELFPTRNEVEGANANRLHLLQGNMFPFPAKDGGSITDKGQRDRLLANCLAPELITLKKGAQVMLIKNIDETLVNGSLGRVIGFMDERQFDSYNNNEDAFMQSPGGTVQSTTDAAAGGEAGDRPRMMEGITTSRKWPLVRFAIADGTWRDLLCQPETWKVELPNGEVQASRAQVPLILAWALSIHKAQVVPRAWQVCKC